MDYQELINRLDIIRNKGVTPANQDEYFNLQSKLDSEPLTVEKFMDDSQVTISTPELNNLVNNWSIYRKFNNDLTRHFGV